VPEHAEGGRPEVVAVEARGRHRSRLRARKRTLTRRRTSQIAGRGGRRRRRRVGEGRGCRAGPRERWRKPRLLIPAIIEIRDRATCHDRGRGATPHSPPPRPPVRAPNLTRKGPRMQVRAWVCTRGPPQSGICVVGGGWRRGWLRETRRTDEIDARGENCFRDACSVLLNGSE